MKFGDQHWVRFTDGDDTDTPIMDRLEQVTGGTTLATFHGQSGGEWDTLRHTSLSVRRSLTSTRWMSLDGEKPDVFADLLRTYGPSDVEPDPIAWFVREARQANAEARTARHRAVMLRVARRHGYRTYHEYRTEQARQQGHDSVWHMRKARGWT